MRRAGPKEPGPLRIERDDLSRPAIHALLDEHLRNMHELSPRESVHALDLDALRRPEITFWSAWEGPLLLARSRSYERLSLETGSLDAFKPAQALYASFGFTYCGPFGDYTDDPNSAFMTLRL